MNVRDERTAAGMTQQELAERIHVTVRTVQNWEAGKTVPSASQTISLRRALGEPKDDTSRLIRAMQSLTMAVERLTVAIERGKAPK